MRTIATAMPTFQEKEYAAKPGDPQHEEDLVGRVGDRREGVAGEHRERDPLGQQRLAETVAAHGAAEQQALDGVRHLWHTA